MVISLDKFPEAFRRFESDVDIDRFDSYRELTLSFQWWSGPKWIDTPRQWAALNREAEKLGFRVPEVIRREVREGGFSGYYVSGGKQKTVTWRREIVTVKGYLTMSI